MTVLFFLLQFTLIEKIQIGNAVPNICLILIVSIAYFNGSSYGAVFGFIIGLLYDIFFGTFLGFYSLLYVLIGYLIGFFNKTFFDLNFDLKLPAIFICVSGFIYNLVTYVCFYLLNGDLNFKYYLINLIIPEIIYTLVVGIIIYRLLFLIDQKLSLDERKADGYFVS